MTYTKSDKVKALYFFMGKLIVHNGGMIQYDGNDGRIIGIRCPDTNASLVDFDPNIHITYINRAIRHNFITMRNMDRYYRQQVSRDTEKPDVIMERDNRYVKRHVEYLKECEFKSYDVDETEECPICYNHYGEQDDGTFLCKDGSSNSSCKSNCKHHCCVKCIKELAKENNRTYDVKCPICRESWAHWLDLNYADPTNISCFEPMFRAN